MGKEGKKKKEKQKALVMVTPVTRLSHVSTGPQRGLIIPSKDVHLFSITAHL